MAPTRTMQVTVRYVGFPASDAAAAPAIDVLSWHF